MTASHLKFLVEEPSMEAFLRALLPRLLPACCTFEVHPFQGKADLLGKLQNRLRGYAQWLPDDWRIIVVVDRDDDNCKTLKQHLEAMAAAAGLRTRSSIVLVFISQIFHWNKNHNNLSLNTEDFLAIKLGEIL